MQSPRFNSRTPGGVRLEELVLLFADEGVSIHAPQEGCDLVRGAGASTSRCFNSRTPGGVRRSGACASLSVRWSFNSRTPGGVRRGTGRRPAGYHRFQFTHPRRGATPPSSPQRRSGRVSIHAPQEGCDYMCFSCQSMTSAFQFTHPRRGATGLRGER